MIKWSSMSNTMFVVLAWTMVIALIAAIIFAPKLIHYLRRLYPTEFKVVAGTLLSMLGVLVVALYFNEPNPRARKVVQFKYESIVTVDGVTELGWLTDCSTGERRHITGDFTVTEDATPVVCVNERHYDKWLKAQAMNRKDNQ